MSWGYMVLWEVESGNKRLHVPMPSIMSVIITRCRCSRDAVKRKCSYFCSCPHDRITFAATEMNSTQANCSPLFVKSNEKNWTEMELLLSRRNEKRRRWKPISKSCEAWHLPWTESVSVTSPFLSEPYISGRGDPSFPGCLVLLPDAPLCWMVVFPLVSALIHVHIASRWLVLWILATYSFVNPNFFALRLVHSKIKLGFGTNLVSPKHPFWASG